MQRTDISRFIFKALSQRLRERLNFIQVLIGPRQVGKTTGAKRIFDEWEGAKHFATADKVAPPDAHWIEVQWEIARAKGGSTLLILDEIQKIPGWDETIKVLFDRDRAERRMRILLLGSASTSIQRGLSESLAGRFELTRIPHWSFSESHQLYAWSLADFLKFGGYPAPGEFASDLTRWQAAVLDGIIEPVLTRDIQGMVQINKPALFRQAFQLALSYPAQEISLQKLLGQLQDRGNVTTIKHYLSLFEGAFLIKTLQKYSDKPIVERGSSPKILPLCPALVHAYRSPTKIDTDPDWFGRIFEMAIGAHLANAMSGTLNYWRKGDAEVDYVLRVEDRTFAIEVKSGRKRRCSGLSEFCNEFKNSRPVLLDRDSGTAFLSTDSQAELLKLLEQ